MKRLLFSVFFVLGFLAVDAQAVRRVIAWSQQSMPGTIPVIQDERGNPVERPIPLIVRYYLYLETRSGEAVMAERIWINGKEYRFIQEPMVKGPVNMNVAKDGLNLQPMQVAGGKFPTLPLTVRDVRMKGMAVPRGYRNNKVVIRYKYKGMIFTIGSKAIRELPPVMNQ